MRQILLTLCAALTTLLLVASAPAVAAGPYVDTAALDELFAELKIAPSATAADDITRQIWTNWMNPSDSELAARMATASAFLTIGDTRSCLKMLDTIVRDFPDYSEGWNQRATVEYMVNDLDASLADIDRTLALEPRHFGALSGRVLIYLKQGKHDAALQDMVRALAIHPFLSERDLFPELAKNVTHV
jgi:tetratricopeptide (TPR) repeat protein